MKAYSNQAFGRDLYCENSRLWLKSCYFLFVILKASRWKFLLTFHFFFIVSKNGEKFLQLLVQRRRVWTMDGSQLLLLLQRNVCFNQAHSLTLHSFSLRCFHLSGDKSFSFFFSLNLQAHECTQGHRYPVLGLQASSSLQRSSDAKEIEVYQIPDSGNLMWVTRLDFVARHGDRERH